MRLRSILQTSRSWRYVHRLCAQFEAACRLATFLMFVFVDVVWTTEFTPSMFYHSHYYVCSLSLLLTLWTVIFPSVCVCVCMWVAFWSSMVLLACLTAPNFCLTCSDGRDLCVLLRDMIQYVYVKLAVKNWMVSICNDFIGLWWEISAVSVWNIMISMSSLYTHMLCTVHCWESTCEVQTCICIMDEHGRG